MHKERSNVHRLPDSIVARKATSGAFMNLASAVADLSRVMERSERFERLLDAFRRSFPCDAIALLKRDGPLLVPLAVQGPSPDARGRHAGPDPHAHTDRRG